MTKNDLARVIVQALHGLPSLPNAGSVFVLRRASRNSKDVLEHQYDLAVRALASVAARKESSP